MNGDESIKSAEIKRALLEVLDRMLADGYTLATFRNPRTDWTRDIDLVTGREPVSEEVPSCDDQWPYTPTCGD